MCLQGELTNFLKIQFSRGQWKNLAEGNGKNFYFSLIIKKARAVHWLGLSTFTDMAPASIPGWGIKIPQATWCGKKIKN